MDDVYSSRGIARLTREKAAEICGVSMRFYSIQFIDQKKGSDSFNKIIATYVIEADFQGNAIKKATTIFHNNHQDYDPIVCDYIVSLTDNR